MPGGQLSFGIYQAIGGEREFSAFWLHLGLPGFAAIGASYLLVPHILSFRNWIYVSISFVAVLAAAVNARAIH